MPQPAFHLVVAQDVLDGWSASGRSPFPLHDAEARMAFRHGALGPDMGFFPGAPRIMSELAHESRTADLPRALCTLAETNAQLAFAWGWATHVLLDAIVHPVVNDVAAELLGRAHRTVRREEIKHMHQRLELGLDIAAQRPGGSFDGLRLSPVFDVQSMRYLSDAYAAVHGIDLSPELFALGHRKVVQWIRPLMLLQAMLTAGEVTEQPDLGARLGLSALRGTVTWWKGDHSSATAFLNPVLPDDRIAARIGAAVARFHAEFHTHVQTDLVLLPNYDLDDGTVTDPPAAAVA